jgi:hypothetical protein
MFEHSLKFFHRANLVRPEYSGVRLSINKCRDAIENSLSKQHGFNFIQFNELIQVLLYESYTKMKLIRLFWINLLNSTIESKY